MDYERGLARLKQQAMGTHWHDEFLLFEAQLRENLVAQMRYGPNESNQAQRNRIVAQLNQLTLHYHLKNSFNELCEDTPPDHKTNQSFQDTQMQKATGSARTDAFISYSPADKHYLAELQTHLAFFIRKGAIHVWDNTKTLPGSNQREDTRKALQAAKIAILLVSADFLASDTIDQDELPPLLLAAEQEGARILPVIVSACVFEDTDLVQFKPINDPSEPLSELSPGKRDMVWKRIAKIVNDTLKINTDN